PQNANAAEAIGEVAADRPQARAGDDTGRGEITRLDLAQLVLHLEEGVEKARQADETAEGYRIKQAEPPRVALPQDRPVGRQRLRGWLRRAVLGEQGEQQQHQG